MNLFIWVFFWTCVFLSPGQKSGSGIAGHRQACVYLYKKLRLSKVTRHPAHQQPVRVLAVPHSWQHLGLFLKI